MAQITWDDTGDRLFELGIDRGVLYLPNVATPWNGLTGVSAGRSGGEVAEYYLDGFKYTERYGREIFQGNISAFTYPDEFAVCDGSEYFGAGLYVSLQRRKKFNLSFRTLIGNDVEGKDHGYKIHMLWNALARPSTKTYSTTNASTTLQPFTWDFTTTSVRLPYGLRPSAYAVADTTKMASAQIRELEQILYGTNTTNGRLPTFPDIVELFRTWSVPLEINQSLSTGLNPLTKDGLDDLRGRLDLGIYAKPDESRLKNTSVPGIDRLES